MGLFNIWDFLTSYMGVFENGSPWELSLRANGFGYSCGGSATRADETEVEIPTKKAKHIDHLDKTISGKLQNSLST